MLANPFFDEKRMKSVFQQTQMKGYRRQQGKLYFPVELGALLKVKGPYARGKLLRRRR